MSAPTSPPRSPRALPAAAPVAVLLAVLLVAAGVVLVRDALVLFGLVAGEVWSTPVLEALTGLSAQTWMVPAGVGAALVGLWWLLAALWPRRRKELEVGTSGVAWTRPRDISRLATAAAGDQQGVVAAQTSASRRKVRVDLRTTTSDAGAVEEVTRAVGETLAPLSTPPRLQVRARAIGDAS